MEIDISTLQQELQEEPEFFSQEEQADTGDDFFTADGDVFQEPDADEPDDVFAGTQAPTRTDAAAIANLLHSVNNMIASTIAAITGQDSRRYMPAKAQTNNVAKAFVKAFPTVSIMNPKWAFFFILVMTYAPVTANAIRDLKNSGNEENTTDNNSWDKRNGENSTVEQPVE